MKPKSRTHQAKAIILSSDEDMGAVSPQSTPDPEEDDELFMSDQELSIDPGSYGAISKKTTPRDVMM